MNLYTKSSLYTLLPNDDRRKEPRKSVRQQVSIGVAGQAIIRGYTVDISANGLSILIPIALAKNAHCAARFAMLINGQLEKIAGTGSVANCSCAGLDGFRIGMTFKAQDPRVQQLLTQFIHQ